MTAACHPLPPDTIQDLLTLATRAICARPDETPAQGAARTRQLVHATLGFEPRDALEYMLSTMIFGHFNLILDAMAAAFQPSGDAARHRTRSGIVALDRAMLGMIRELRTARKRPAAQGEASEARSEARPATATPPSPNPAKETPRAAATPADTSPIPAHPMGTPRPDNPPVENLASRTSSSRPPPGETGPRDTRRLGGPSADTGVARRSPQSSAATVNPTARLPLGLANFPPSAAAEDDALLLAHLAAFQQAHAEALDTLTKTPPRTIPAPVRALAAAR